MFASYLLMPLVLFVVRVPGRMAKAQSLPRAAAAGAFSLAAYTLVLWATRYVEIGVVSALRETSVLWAIVLGRLFLGEAFTWRKAASALLICTGIVILAFTSR